MEGWAGATGWEVAGRLVWWRDQFSASLRFRRSGFTERDITPMDMIFFFFFEGDEEGNKNISLIPFVCAVAHLFFVLFFESLKQKFLLL